LKPYYETKLGKTKSLITDWVETWGIDHVAISYSGGKDSGVLLHIARSVYPSIKGVFSNTGLEYAEIVSLVKRMENIDIIRPKKPFHQVIKEYGWPVISKQVSRFISDCQNASDRNKKTVNLRMTGITSTGQKAPSQRLSNKWRFLIDAPFKCSNRCCDILKKDPLRGYARGNNIYWMTGMMRQDSDMRDKILTKTGCNSYDSKYPISAPLADWTDTDIWEYTHKHNVPYASVYDNGEKRTGCVFCMFGIMYDKDRFIRLKRNSPKQWDFVINKLGGGKVLDFLGIETGKYKPKRLEQETSQLKLFTG